MTLDWIRDELERLQRQSLRRRRAVRRGAPGAVITFENTELTAFASNDYLGLAGDERLIAAAAAAAREEGVGSGAS
ncbi:MAG: 8-amino-7-oxononanoate synthase, partial [Pirellulales bacterium]